MCLNVGLIRGSIVGFGYRFNSRFDRGFGYGFYLRLDSGLDYMGPISGVIVGSIKSSFVGLGLKKPKRRKKRMAQHTHTQ